MLESPVGLAPNTKEDHRLKEFIAQEMAKFEKDTGITPLIKHNIVLENPTLIKQRYRPRNPVMQKIIDTEVEKMLKDHVIRPSSSPWSSPIVLAKKKDGKSRFCVALEN